MKLYATPRSLHDDLDLYMKEWSGVTMSVVYFRIHLD